MIFKSDHLPDKRGLAGGFAYDLPVHPSYLIFFEKNRSYILFDYIFSKSDMIFCLGLPEDALSLQKKKKKKTLTNFSEHYIPEEYTRAETKTFSNRIFFLCFLPLFSKIILYKKILA